MLKYREFSVMFLGILISSDGNAEDGARFGGTAFGGWQCWHTVHKRCPWFILIPCQHFWRGVVFLYFTYCTSVVLGEDLQERGRVKGSDDFFGRWVWKKLHAYGQLIQIPTRNYLKKSVGMFRIVWMFHVDNWWLMIFDYISISMRQSLALVFAHSAHRMLEAGKPLTFKILCPSRI